MAGSSPAGAGRLRSLVCALAMAVAFGAPAAGQPAAPATAQSTDLYGDGRSSLKVERDAAGQIERVSIDAGGSGSPDIVLNFKARPMVAEFYEQGRLVRRILSDSMDDAVDYRMPAQGPWTKTSYLAARDSGVITVVEWTDATRSGRFRGPGTTTRLPFNEATEQAGPLATNIASSCSAQQRDLIKQAIDRMLASAGQCLGAGDRVLMGQWLATLRLAGLTINCDGPSPTNACSQAIDAGTPFAWARAIRYGGLRIDLHSQAFDAAVCPADLAETLFHETLHYVFGPHPNPGMDHGRGDPNDRVYACQHACFGARTPQNCSACFAVPAGAPVCTPPPPLPHLECPPPGTPPGCTVKFTTPIDSGTLPRCHASWDPKGTPWSFTSFEIYAGRNPEVMMKAGVASSHIWKGQFLLKPMELTKPTAFNFGNTDLWSNVTTYVAGGPLVVSVCNGTNVAVQQGSGEILMCPMAMPPGGMTDDKLISVVGYINLDCQSGDGQHADGPFTPGAGLLQLQYVPGGHCCNTGDAR